MVGIKELIIIHNIYDSNNTYKGTNIFQLVHTYHSLNGPMNFFDKEIIPFYFYKSMLVESNFDHRYFA